MRIRNSAKAVIVQDSKLLAIKKRDKDGDYYTLPGGGQEHGENLHQTLKRECIEEINVEVGIDYLVCIREYIGKNHEHIAFDLDVHQIEYMFYCKINDSIENVRTGIVPDEGQIGVEWIDLSKLQNYRLYPQTVRKYIVDYVSGKEIPVYLGDIN